MTSAQRLCRPIVFHTPERTVHPPSWLEHTPFAFWIVDALRPATFVELGCHSGNSYSSFAQAVQTLGLSTACYAVDTWGGDPHSGVFEEGVFEDWVEYHDRRFSAFSRLIRATFDEAREQFGDRSVDLLHIDGYHTFDAVAHDFEVWRRKMSDRGVMLFHDISVREKDFGVWRLWDRLRGDYPSFELHHGHGLGVLAVGPEMPAALEWLFAADAENADLVRKFFARLGAAVLSRYEASRAQQALQSEAKARDERVNDLTAELETLRSENGALRERLRSVDEDMARLQTREAQRRHPTIVVVSHIGAWRPRAGNEYRLNRIFRWYRRKGYRILPVIAPLPGEELSRADIEGTAAAFGNVIHLHRDGRIEHDLRDIPDSLRSFATMAPTGVPVVPAEQGGSAGRTRELLNLERTFCHGALISTVLQLQQLLGPHILQVEYIWMTRLLPLVRADVLKVIDTVDVFSSVEQKVGMFGLRDIGIERDDEAERLCRSDLIIAIQDEERQELERLVPSVPVITAGVDFDVVGDSEGAIDGRILYVASGNPRNRKGLSDFVRFAWPRIRRRVAHARLVVAGDVGKALADGSVPGVSVVGVVEDTSPLYREAALVINPVVAGTGVKIKTLEALCHLRPIVTWPAGVDGLHTRLAARCLIARDWYEFANVVADALATRRPRQFTAHDRAVIADLVSAETTYRALDAAYAAYFDGHGLSVDGGPATRGAAPIAGIEYAN
jgi:hypothetical protein